MIVGRRALGVGRYLGYGGALCLWLAWSALVARADPHADYMLHCQGCHGPEGRGASGGAPPFPNQIARFTRVAGGREYLLRVPGVTQSELDDARTAAVLNWVLREFDAAHLPADFVPLSAYEVAQHRHSPLTKVSAMRAALLSGAAPYTPDELP